MADIDMQVPMQGIVVGLSDTKDYTNKDTGEVRPGKSIIHLLTGGSDGVHAVQSITCSKAYQEQYRDMNFRMDGSAPKVVKLLVNMRSWEINGSKGISLKAVEVKP